MNERDVLKVSLAEVLAFLFRGLLPALILGSLGAAAAYLISRNPTPQYRATAILLATRPNSGFANAASVIEPTQVDPDVYRAAIVQGGLLESALANVLDTEQGPQELSAWRRRVRVRVDENLISGLVRVEVEDKSPERATAVANALADSLLAWDRDRVNRNVQATVASLRQSIVLLGAQLTAAEQAGDSDQAQALKIARDQRLGQLRSAETLSLSAVVMGLLEPFRGAVADPRPVNDRTAFVTAVSFVLFFVLAYLLSLVILIADPRVRNASDLSAATGLTVFGPVPDAAKRGEFHRTLERIAIALLIPNPRAPLESVGESKLRGNAARPDPAAGQEATRDCKVIMVTSATNSNERGQLAANLAGIYARGGWRVLLVDADFQETRISASFPARKEAATLGTILQNRDGGNPAVLASSDGTTLDLIVAGREPMGGAAALLGRRAPELIEGWRVSYDLVVFDAPDLNSSASSLALSPLTDSTLLAVAGHRTRLRAASTAAEDLLLAGVKDLRMVLMNPPRFYVKQRSVRSRFGVHPQTESGRVEDQPRQRATVVQRSARPR